MSTLIRPLPLLCSIQIYLPGNEVMLEDPGADGNGYKNTELFFFPVFSLFTSCLPWKSFFHDALHDATTLPAYAAYTLYLLLESGLSFAFRARAVQI